MNNYKVKGHPSKQTAIDPFRMVAAFLIVAIHTAPLSSFSKTADFLFSYCFARIAVPFFLMVTGYFVLAPLIAKTGSPTNPQKNSSSYKVFWKGMKKTALLYLAATILYLPVNIYSGKLPSLKDLFKTLIFDGTFYHLWYLPAALLGMLLLFLLSQKCSSLTMLILCGALYFLGVWGDSWYGLASQLPPIRSFYDILFGISSYTRNGIFYAPLFLLMGALISRSQVRKRFDFVMISMIGTFCSLLLMLGEGFLTYTMEWQRHNSMYFSLVPCMFFLFRLLLCLPGKSSKPVRDATLLIYLLHPLVIILIRGFAKLTHLSAYLVENSLLHYLAVCVASAAVAFILSLFIQKIPKRRLS